jgi:hypothetical protein
MLCKLDYESGELGSYLGFEIDLSLELGLRCDNYLLVVPVALCGVGFWLVDRFGVVFGVHLYECCVHSVFRSHFLGAPS